MKCCVLITSYRNQLYDDIKDQIRNSWALDLKQQGIDYYFYEGGWDVNAIEGDIIKTNCIDEEKFSFKKFIVTNTILKDQKLEYTFVYKTILSTYIDVSNLIKYIEYNRINEISYVGTYYRVYLLAELLLKFELLKKFASSLNRGEKIQYHHGSGVFIGITLIDQMIKNYLPLEQSFLKDDVFIGLLLQHEKKQNAQYLRMNISADGSHKLLKNQFQFQIEKNFLFQYLFKYLPIEEHAKMIQSLHNSETRMEICTRKNIN
jgi:hypothetical protein